MRAVDTDIGLNGQVRYRIRRDPLGNYLSFRVDPETGVITLTRPLDRERQKIHEIRVEAYDLGLPTSLQSDLDLTIYVKNVNDHEPQFLIDEFAANFTENKNAGAERVLLINTVDRDDDDDETQIADVCYFIVDGNDDNMFELLPLDHELMVTRQLDREERDEYQLVVKATEECLSPPTERIAFDATDDSLLKLNVFVNDVDDNAPQFTKPVFTGGISTDIDFGAIFMAVKAEDLDEGVNAEMQYSLDGEIIPSDSSEGLEGIRKPPFIIDSSTGDLILNFDPQKGMKGHFDFGVRVFDRAGHVDKAQVQIYLLREDQRVRIVMRSQPAEVRATIDRFLGVLGESTDAIVNADGFKVHENHEDGSIDKTKTDVLLHFVDPTDNSVMEVADVLRLIDLRTEELNDLFREYNVIHTEGVDPSYATAGGLSAASNETILLIWLAGICAFLFLLLIVVLCMFIHQRNKFNRKLRAATTSAFGDSASGSVLNRKELVPNTNRHATEGSNPIWMSGVGYDNLDYAKDDDDEHMLAAHKRGKENLSRYRLPEEPLDSLDANVLNAAAIGSNPTESSDDVGYAASSHFSNGGSTMRVTAKKALSTSSTSSASSSGVGSGASRPSRAGRQHLNDLTKGGPGPNGVYSKNSTIAALFPAKMPAVDKSFTYGSTTYDEDDVPRTEL